MKSTPIDRTLYTVRFCPFLSLPPEQSPNGPNNEPNEHDCNGDHCHNGNESPEYSVHNSFPFPEQRTARNGTQHLGGNGGMPFRNSGRSALWSYDQFTNDHVSIDSPPFNCRSPARPLDNMRIAVESDCVSPSGESPFVVTIPRSDLFPFAAFLESHSSRFWHRINASISPDFLT